MHVIRHGARGLRRSPVFTAAALATLTVGIGGTVALFSVVRAVLLQPLPYDPEAARSILRAKGYATAEGEAGETLSVTLLTNAGNRTREDALVKIQAHLAKVGVDVSIQPLEMRTMRGQVVSGDFDPAAARSWIEQYFGEIHARAAPPRTVVSG